MRLQINDGGRAAAGYTGKTGDCVVRAIAIAAQLPYQQVYDELETRTRQFAEGRRSKVARAIQKRGASPRNGGWDDVYKPYLVSLGFRWVATMGIGTGCRVHLRDNELPAGRIIASVSKHLVAVIDGVVHDTHDPTRAGTRCVYGYFTKAVA